MPDDVEIGLHFTNEDWERVERAWTAWWAGELGRPLVAIETEEPPPGAVLPEVPGLVSEMGMKMPADELLDRIQTHLEATRYYGDAWPRWWPNFGPGIIAGFLGAQVHWAPHTVWFSPAQTRPITDLKLTYAPENVWWQRVQELTRLAVTRWGGRVAISHTDLGGNLDILASLRTTQQLLLDLYDAPDEIIRLVNEINRLWIRYYEELYIIIQKGGRGTCPWDSIWSPRRCYMLQCDFSYMISPEMFERFVLPDLENCCQFLDHPFYHLDGVGQIRHLDMLLSLKRLRGIQWIPGDGKPPSEDWLPLLKRIRDAGKLCQLFVSPKGAQTIVGELGGHGFAFYITQSLSKKNAQDLLRILTAPHSNS